jgi:hypothetical protein
MHWIVKCNKSITGVLLLITSVTVLAGCQAIVMSPPAESPSPQAGTVEPQEKGAAMDESVEWLRYSNSQFKFSISYLSTYVILDESESPEDTLPPPVFRVQFQDRALATSETADLQVPMAAVEVFRKEQSESLEEWLDLHGESGSRSPITGGGLQGYRVSLPVLMAPNEFTYFASDTYVYRLTLLGPFAEEILQSFKIEQ